jgi:hypothetical protein
MASIFETLKEQIANLDTDLKKETDDSIKEVIKARIQRLEKQLHDENQKLQDEADDIDKELKSKRVIPPDVRDAMQKRFDQIGAFITGNGPEPEPYQTRQAKRAQQQSTVNNLKRQLADKTRSSQDNTKTKLDIALRKAQLKALRKSTPKASFARTSSGGLRFSLPKFATDNATGIVIAEILVLIGLQVGIATKFVSLWNYAFSPNTTTPINPTTSQVHGSSNTSLHASVPLSVVPQVNSGAGLLEYWGVPTEFSYVGGYDW